MSCPHGNDPETCSWCLQPQSADEYVKKMQDRDRGLDAIHAERLRVDRWHATYNAALTGLYASDSKNEWSPAEHTEEARVAAELAHGPLKP